MIGKAILFGVYTAVAGFSFIATLFAIVIAISAIYAFFGALVDIFKR